MMIELKPNLTPITEGVMFNFKERRNLTPQELTSEILKLREELEAATKYIEEHEVIHKKFKKNIPTVIEYQGRRYVLDDRN
jgi:hypothetical protein